MTETNTIQIPTVVEEARKYVNIFFKEKMPTDLLYHNWAHTEEVAEAAQELAIKAGITKGGLELVLLAAWFHDTGYAETYNGHENKSAEIAGKFLSEIGYDANKKQEVMSLIKSTVNGHNPQNLKEEILHDADLAHTGRKRFFRKGELLRAELQNYSDDEYDELEWQKMQYQFLINNDFITQAAKEEYGTRRVKNIKKQRQNIVKARKITIRNNTGKDLGRGIDTLYRSNYRNHINLSSIADGKANMMISINTIMISVIVTLSGASLSVSQSFVVENLRFTVPILILLVGALASLVFAILSARPKVTENEVDSKKVRKNEMSLLYFGNFLGVSKEEFMNYLNNLKEDQQRLYDSMSIDLYSLGIVLKEKYRLLSVSYNIFMISLTVTVVTFIFIFFYTNAA